MGYDVKVQTQTQINRKDILSKLLYRFKFTTDQDVLDGYTDRIKYTISKLVIPELALSFLDDDKDYINFYHVDEEIEMEPKYDMKPELVLYEKFKTVDDYLYPFMYLNGIFSRIDFNFNKISKVKLYNRNIIDNAKNVRVASMEPREYTPKELGVTPDHLEKIEDENQYYINKEEFFLDTDDIEMNEEVYNLMIEKFYHNNLDTIERNMSNTHIVSKLKDEIGADNLVYYLAMIKSLKPIEDPLQEGK